MLNFNRESPTTATKSFCNIINIYTQRSSIAGINHIHQSTSRTGKLIWLGLTLIGALFSAVHIVMTISTYRQTPVYSLNIYRQKRTVFPDITFCNLQLFSKSVARKSSAVQQSIEKRWNSFRDIIKLLDKHSPASQETNKARANQVMAMFWASEDTRDIVVDDDIMIIHCEFMNQKCNSRNFKMVFNWKYFNCYTFKPQTIVSNINDDRKGLTIMLFTNTYLLEDLHTLSEDISVSLNDTARTIMSSDLQNVRLQNYLNAQRMDPSGMRVIIHEPNTYPFPYKNSFIVGNGVYAEVEFSMESQSFIDRQKSPCF